MKPATILSALFSFVATRALAAPYPSYISPRDSSCLSDSDANDIVTKFASLMTAYDASVAQSLIADNGFTDTSDSVNFLAGYPLGSVTYPSKQAFLDAQAAQTPLPSFDTLNVYYNCDVITWRWRVNLSPNPVLGISIFVVVSNNGTRQIQTTYAEFNSGTWAQDIGGSGAQTNGQRVPV